MLRRAGDHPLLAGAANPELAGIVDVDAGIEQHLQDALAFGDDEFLSGAGEFDDEAAAFLSTSCFGVKYSTWICSRGQSVVAASNALSIGVGPQQ